MAGHSASLFTGPEAFSRYFPKRDEWTRVKCDHVAKIKQKCYHARSCLFNKIEEAEEV